MLINLFKKAIAFNFLDLLKSFKNLALIILKVRDLRIRKILTFLLIGVLALNFSACKEEETDEAAKIVATKNISNNLDLNLNHAAQIKFDKNIDPASVNKDTIIVKDKTGKVLDKKDYAVGTIDDKIIVNFSDKVIKQGSNNFNVEIKGVKDAFDKEVKITSESVDINKKPDVDKNPPEISSVNSGFDFKINAATGLRLVFNEQIKSDFKVRLQKADNSIVPTTDYEATLDAQGLVLTISFKNDLRKTSADFNLVFDKLTDIKDNQIVNKNFKFTLEPVKNLVLLQDNLERLANGKAQIKTDKEIILTFSDAVETTTINPTNLSLQDENSTPLNNSTDYKIEQDSQNKNIIKISLKNTDLIKKSADYKIVIGALTDLKSNPFANANSSEKIIEFTFIDSVAPSLKTSNLSTQTSVNKELKSNQPIILEFSEILKIDTLTKDNIVLKNKTGMALSEDQYKIVQDSSDKTKVNLTLVDANLQNQTAEYKLEIKQGLTDEAGNTLKQAETIDFKFIDSVAPAFVETNLDATKKIKANKKLILTFSEKLKTDTVKIENIVLKDGTRALDAHSYQVVQDSNDTTKINLTLVDSAFQSQTKEYTLEIKQGLTDEAGNALKQAKTFAFTFTDSVAPSLANFDSINDSEFETNAPMKLRFSEAIKDDNLRDKIKLHKCSVPARPCTNYVEVESNLYNVSLDPSYASVVKIELQGSERNADGKYKIYIEGVEDLNGNLFESSQAGNVTNNVTLKFNFNDKFPPELEMSSVSQRSPDNPYYFLEDIPVEFSECAGCQSLDSVYLKFSEPLMPVNPGFPQSDPSKNIKVYIDSNEMPGFGIELINERYIRVKLPPNLDPLQEYTIKILSNLQDLHYNFFGREEEIKFRPWQKNNVIYVKDNGIATNYGTSWNTAKDIKTAFAESENKLVLVANGTYSLAATDQLEPKNNSKIYGSVDSNAPIFVRDASEATGRKSIIDGGNLDRTGYFIRMENSGTNYIDGFSLTNYNHKLGESQDSATILLSRATATLKNLAFKDNVTNVGAIFDIQSTLNLQDSLFENNKSIKTNYGGGGLYVTNQIIKLKINGTKFINNKSVNGGAIYLSDENNENSIFIANSFFKGNEAGRGGAIYANLKNNSSQFRLTNSTFVENKATDNTTNGQSGGGIYVENKPAVFDVFNSIFWKNTSIKTGGVKISGNIHNNATGPNNKITVKNTVSDQGIDATTTTINDPNFNNKSDLTNFAVEDSGEIRDISSQHLIKDKGNTSLYLQVYGNIFGTSSTSTNPALVKDLLGGTRIKGTIDIGAYEVQN